jgi:hypothetical protein
MHMLTRQRPGLTSAMKLFLFLFLFRDQQEPEPEDNQKDAHLATIPFTRHEYGHAGDNLR